MVDSFEVQGVEFELTPLKVEQQLALYPVLVEVLAPAANLAGGKSLTEEEIKTTVTLAIQSAACLQKLVSAFRASCTVGHDTGNGVQQMPLKAGDFFERAFQRKPTLLLGWVVECAFLEFGDFLAGNGLNSLLTGSLSKFQNKSGGKSGE